MLQRICGKKQAISVAKHNLINIFNIIHNFVTQERLEVLKCDEEITLFAFSRSFSNSR